MLFDGEVTWITGSSKGLGRAVAIGLAEEGCNVAVHYNSSKDEAQKDGRRFGQDRLPDTTSDVGEVRLEKRPRVTGLPFLTYMQNAYMLCSSSTSLVLIDWHSRVHYAASRREMKRRRISP